MNVWDKLNHNLYSNQDPCPTKPRKPRIGAQASAADYRAHADALEAYELAHKEFRAQAQAWQTRSGELEAEFKNDLEAHYDMTGHAKAGLLYAKAWEQGHHAGLHEVACVYSDLVELVQ